MHIKRVVINNFMSYRGRHVVDGLVPGQNVIVGENGSGKTNFLQAIEFVLTDDIRRLKPIEKYVLINEGRYTDRSDPYVEIVFTGCSHNLKFENNELRIRRVLYKQKDSYFVNGKRTNQERVKQLFEISGCSIPKSFIIQQKMINSVLNLSGAKLLDNMIKWLGLTISDSIRSFNYNIKTLEELKEKFDFRESWLKQTLPVDETLRLELMELENFESLNHLKTGLNILIKLKEVNVWSLEKSEILRNMKIQSEDVTDYMEKVKKLEDDIVELEKVEKEAKEECSYYSQLREATILDKYDVLKEKERISLTISDLKKEADILKSEVSSKEEEEELDLSSIDEQILELIEKHSNKTGEYLDKMAELEKEENVLIAKECRYSGYLKMGSRIDSTEMKKDSKTRIQNKIREVDTQIKALSSEKEDISKRATQLSMLKIKFEDSLGELEARDIDEIQLVEQEVAAKSNHIKLVEKLNELRKRGGEILLKLGPMNDELSDIKVKLRKKLGNVMEGNESVKTVLEVWRREGSPYYDSLVEGYHGMLIEGFTCDPSLNIAVEVAVGKKLFYHIVRDPRVGTEILREMNKRHLPGEVWFIPLNTVRVFQSYTDHNREWWFPMIEKLDYRNEIEAAIKFAFGNVLVCRDIGVAVLFSRQFKSVCVTLSGDKVRCDGVMSGGHMRQDMSSRALYLNLTQLKQQMALHNSELDTLQKTIESVDSEVEKTVRLIRKIRHEREFGQKTEKYLVREKLADIERWIDKEKEKSREVDRKTEQLREKRETLLREMKQEAPVDKSELLEILQGLKKEIRAMKKKVGNLHATVFKLKTEKCDIELEIEQYRKKRDSKENINSKLVENRIRYDSCKKDLQFLEDRLKTLADNVKMYEDKISAANISLSEAVSKLEVNRANKEKLSPELMDKSEMGPYRNKLEMYENRIQENLMWLRNRNLENMAELHSQYADYNLRQLKEELVRVETELKNMTSINKNVRLEIEMKQKFMKKLDKMLNNLSISYDLVMQYEDRMGSWLRDIMEKVSNRFGHLFNRLFPNSSGTLELIYGATEEQQEGDWSIGGLNGASLKIESPGYGRLSNINVLSGGEKMMLFLCLVFSYIPVSSAPVYLLDEIDRTLDDEHAERLSNVLRELEPEAQMITCSHSQQILHSAQKFFFVNTDRTGSRIQEVDRSRIEQFLETTRSVVHETSSENSFSEN